MAKEVASTLKLQLPAGQATPAPPVGPALGQHGVNIGQFVKEYNDATREQTGLIIPVELTVYTDRSFSFVLKTPPAAVLLKRAAGIVKGVSMHMEEGTVGSVTGDQVREIAATKMADLNARTEDSAFRIIAGTARSMGIEIKD